MVRYERAVPVRRSDSPEHHRTRVRLTRLVLVLTLLAELLLLIRLSLKLIAASPASLVARFTYNIQIDFARIMYTMTGPLVAPFRLLTGPPATKGSELEIAVLVAMPVYALLGWMTMRLIRRLG